MKKFLLAMSFALLVPACLGDVADPASPPDDTAATFLSPSSLEPSTLPMTTCLNNCQTQLDACITRAQGDALAECLCDNHFQLCKLSCGGHGFTHGC